MIYNFPDELVSNDKKKTFEYGREYASAIWQEWESRYISQYNEYKKCREYALGKHCIDRIVSNITNNGKLIKKEYLKFDRTDRVTLMPQFLRSFINSVDMSQFIPVVRAIDNTAMMIKTERKADKMKLLYAKDFIADMVQFTGENPYEGQEIPQSKEQVELEEDIAKPLRVERAELKALQFISDINDFSLRQKEFLKDALVYNKMVAKIDTDPIEGIKIERINPQDYISGEKRDIFYSTTPYHGVVKEITIGMFKNIAKESGLKFTDEEIRNIARISEYAPMSDNAKIKVLFYAFKTFFQDVYKKKTNRKTKSISLINRTKDVGTKEEYNPKQASDISEKVVNNYDVWFEGVMVLDSERTIIRHRLMKNIPEYKGKILPPYVVCSPREESIVKELIPKIDAIQELRLRILHHRNNLKGDITMIDPDSIANITLGNEKLSPYEVLSFFFGHGIAFDKKIDEDGDFINRGGTINVLPENIPRALMELTNQYIMEIQEFQRSFGAFQLEQVKADPKTLYPQEPFKMSDNTMLRDYTDCLFDFSIKILQIVSARINDAFGWKHIRDMFIDNISDEDVVAIEQYRKDRKSHYFSVYLEYIPSQQEKQDFMNDLMIHIQSGVLDAVDKMELANIKNPLQARSILKLKLEENKKKMQEFEMQKIQETQSASVQASNVAYENKMKLSAQEHQQKMELERLHFQNEAFLLQKQGEIKIMESENIRNYKSEIERFRNKFNADLTTYKKEMDAKTRKEIQEISAQNQANLIKLRKGEIDELPPVKGKEGEEVDNIDVPNDIKDASLPIDTTEEATIPASSGNVEESMVSDTSKGDVNSGNVSEEEEDPYKGLPIKFKDGETDFSKE